MKTLNKLNAKSIKKALSNNGIKALRCAKCTGSARNAINIVVSVSDVYKALDFFKEFGIVKKGNKEPIFNGTSYDYVDFGYLHMSDKMYNELNN